MKGDFLSVRFHSQVCSRKWLQKIVKMPGTIPSVRKNHALLRLKLLSCAASVLSPVLMISLFDTHSCFLIRWSQDVSGAPYAAELMWTHYFSFDIISIQTCQPVQIGLQTVPSRTWDLSTVTNERPVLWRISQSEARTGEDVCVTTIFHVPSDFLLPCHTQQQST